MARKIRSDPEVLQGVCCGDPDGREGETARDVRIHRPLEGRNGEPQSLRQQQQYRGAEIAQVSVSAQQEEGERGHDHVRRADHQCEPDAYRYRDAEPDDLIDGVVHDALREHEARVQGVDRDKGQDERQQERSVEQAFRQGADRDAAASQRHQGEAVVLPREVPGAARYIEGDEPGAECDVIQPGSKAEYEEDREVDREDDVASSVFPGVIHSQECGAVVGCADGQRDRGHEPDGPLLDAGRTAQDDEQRNAHHIQQSVSA